MARLTIAASFCNTKGSSKLLVMRGVLNCPWCYGAASADRADVTPRAIRPLYGVAQNFLLGNQPLNPSYLTRVGQSSSNLWVQKTCENEFSDVVQ